MAKDKTMAKALFIQHVGRELDAKSKHNKKSIERIALSYGIIDKSEVKEFTELAILLHARNITLSSLSTEEKYSRIVALYQSQVNLSHRTSQSILLQQYSTHAPIAFLAGTFILNSPDNYQDSAGGFVNADHTISVFEPSAGNGLLTIAALPSNVVVNEVDALRRANLIDQGYKQVLKQDATLPSKALKRSPMRY